MALVVQVNTNDFKTIIKVPQNSVSIFEAIVEELTKAKSKHPEWPNDPVHASAIVAEESGELTRASLHLIYEDGDMKDVVKEAVQTAVTAIRFLEGVGKYDLRTN